VHSYFKAWLLFLYTLNWFGDFGHASPLYSNDNGTCQTTWEIKGQPECSSKQVCVFLFASMNWSSLICS
jgi:hypothetical protein